MKHERLTISEKELEDITSAKAEIEQICNKYNVYLSGNALWWDSEYDYEHTITTRNIDVYSSIYDKRQADYEKEQEEQAKTKLKLDTENFLQYNQENYPNHRNIELYEEEWREPNIFGHKPWTHTSTFVRGLRVKNYTLILKHKKDLFGWNPNGFWQYIKHIKNDQLRTSVSVYIYENIERPVIYSHPSNLKKGIYSEGSDMSDIQSQAFVIQIIDELIDFGILELI